jgi:hypothetical protein
MQPIVYWFKSQYLLPDTSQKQQEFMVPTPGRTTGFLLAATRMSGPRIRYPQKAVLHHTSSCTLWLFNIAMENGPFIDGLPNLKMVIFHGNVK